ncbi:MAG: hypothetical protein SFY95_04315 [Planctomycetota bacterium]|nr:hypothetical protein [Planctomycetota bacterium]
MSQFGMAMPGGRRRGSSPNVYTGLALIALLFLAAACVFAWMGATKVSPDGGAFSIQEAGKIKLPAAASGKAN